MLCNFYFLFLLPVLIMIETFGGFFLLPILSILLYNLEYFLFRPLNDSILVASIHVDAFVIS